MRRIDTATRAADLFGAGKDGFKDGNLGLGIAPTDFNAAWPNEIQEEIANVIEANGTALIPGTRTQLRDALRGRLISRHVLTATQVYTPTPGTTRVLVLVQGGGGGGGSAAGTAAGQCASGAGGGAGGWARKLITAGFAGVTVTIGAAGASANSPSSGGNGGSTSFGALLSATGGTGGSHGPVQPNTQTAPVGAGQGGVGSLGDENGQGGSGLYALYGPSPISGKGGDSHFGAGANGITGFATGLSATAYGTGGGGGNCPPSTGAGATSGFGAQGVCVIEEYA